MLLRSNFNILLLMGGGSLLKHRVAKYITIIGHPFVTFSFFVIIVMFASEGFYKALLIIFLIDGCLIMPNVIRNHIKTRKGEYTNFDVSVRTQRHSMYLFAMPLMLIIIMVLFCTGQSINLCLGVLFGLLLIFVSFIVNFFVKSSMHVSLTIYLSFLVIPLNIMIGIIIMLLTAAIGWSRVELKRHTIKEVCVGAIIGFIIGVSMLFVEGIL